MRVVTITIEGESPIRPKKFCRMRAFIGFAGFGGVEIALHDAGIETISIEINPAIAEVSRHNGSKVITADILDIAPADFAGCFLTHFSPPCPSFSVARNSKARQDIISRIDDLAYHQSLVNGESELDIRFARKICEFIRVIKPAFFTLENVWLYRKSQSWFLIWYTLLEEGYGVDSWNLNAADYGVPQSRRRMIVIARRDGRPPTKPWPTHSKIGDMFTRPWIGWYEAIEDLIPGLPESQFAPWQWDRLPDEMKTFLVMTGNTSRDGIGNKPGRGIFGVDQPANTVHAEPGGGMPRAMLIPGDNASNGVIRQANEPMVTVQTRPLNRCPHRAFILGQSERSKPKAANLPADTVTANSNQTGVRALIMDSANSNSNDGKGTMRGGDNKPMFTVTTNEKSAPAKAVIIADHNGTQHASGRDLVILGSEKPVFAILASANHRTIRAGLGQGRVVSMNPRCLARFQDFPDSFILPGEPGLDDNSILLLSPLADRELACRGIGNALPPRMYKAVLRSLDL